LVLTIDGHLTVFRQACGPYLPGKRSTSASSSNPQWPGSCIDHPCSGAKGKAMNWDQLEANWTEYAGAARAHWSKLTAEDWKTISGKDHLTTGIRIRYGVSEDEAGKQVEEWSRALPDFVRVSKAR
jgi:uncharacterized protein YjbJ (UPF0337 family)